MVLMLNISWLLVVEEVVDIILVVEEVLEV
jgi:hypothetical protein